MLTACTRQPDHHPRLSRWQMFAERDRIDGSTPGCLQSFAIAHQLMIVIKRAAPVTEPQKKERR